MPGETGKDAWAYLIQESGTGQQGHAWQPEAADGCSRRRRLWRRRRLRGVREEQVGQSVPACKSFSWVKGSLAVALAGQASAGRAGEPHSYALGSCSPPALELPGATGTEHISLTFSLCTAGKHT